MLDPHFYSETSPERERHDLILEHLHRVRDVARRIHRRLPRSVSLDDLASTGVVGLIAAIDRFDPSRGVTLKTYAEHRSEALSSIACVGWIGPPADSVSKPSRSSCYYSTGATDKATARRRRDRRSA
jgi:RNA polymerase sigma factor (sigma-70 family)